MKRYIKQIKEIQNGSGIDRSPFPEKMKGEVAKRYWHNSMFSYGFEYGFIFALLMNMDWAAVDFTDVVSMRIEDS